MTSLRGSAWESLMGWLLVSGVKPVPLVMLSKAKGGTGGAPGLARSSDAGL